VPQRGVGERDLAREQDQPGLLLAEPGTGAADQVDDHQGERVEQQVGAAGDAGGVGQLLQQVREEHRQRTGDHGDRGEDLAAGLPLERRAGAQGQHHGQHEGRHEDDLDDHLRLQWVTR
jgi:hypothetical protein